MLRLITFPRMLLLLGLSALLLTFTAESCNEAVCGSIVSKCLLTKACNCDLKSRVCSKECFVCLGHLYNECCSCVEMCPVDTEGGNVLSKQSNVEDFVEPVPDLFTVLTELPDQFDRWNVTVYPVKVDIREFPDKQINVRKQMPDIEENIIIVNCTVIFWSNCMSWYKCKNSCLSMGASSYRWFHDGCCECVGPHCINYGINESRCALCSFPNLGEEEDLIQDIDESNLDFGEDDYDHFEG